LTVAFHLSALRAAVAHVEALGVRGKLRTALTHAFLAGAAHTSPDTQFREAVELVRIRGWREVQTQIHILSLAQRGQTKGTLP
jgi:hypothetical protein